MLAAKTLTVLFGLVAILTSPLRFAVRALNRLFYRSSYDAQHPNALWFITALAELPLALLSALCLWSVPRATRALAPRPRGAWTDLLKAKLGGDAFDEAFCAGCLVVAPRWNTHVNNRMLVVTAKRGSTLEARARRGDVSRRVAATPRVPRGWSVEDSSWTPSPRAGSSADARGRKRHRDVSARLSTPDATRIARGDES